MQLKRFSPILLTLLATLALGANGSLAFDDQAGSCQLSIIIQRGDTLGKICREHLGGYNQSIARRVMALNPGIQNPNLIYAGDSICLAAPSQESTSTANVYQEEAPDVSDISPLESLETTIYPPPAPGSIDHLKWINDNAAIVEGQIHSDALSRFFVHVPGDLEYEQMQLVRPTNNTFRVKAIIGRKGRDYGQTFIMKLALFNSLGERIGEIRRSFIRQPHEVGEVVWLGKSLTEKKKPGPSGWDGITAWLDEQTHNALDVDNAAFRIPNGQIVTNYRYMGYNPDERYLSWYGRVTLYGSSCLVKALLLKSRSQDAERILRTWTKQVQPDGKVPRSANVIGDNYISPDIRTGEVAHFLGAMAAARLATGSDEWDAAIEAIVIRYLPKLADPQTGLIRGGYNGVGSQGYNRPISYEPLPWCSSEHNFDLYQSLMLLHHIHGDSEFGNRCKMMADRISAGIENYLWDEKDGTFHRGWRPDTGADRARALDCASWGALYWLKRAMLFENENANSKSRSAIWNAKRCLGYADRHFKASWQYQTPDGRTGTIRGYRPYAGLIDDLRYMGGPKRGEMIDWNNLNNMVWSEGTIGVAMAWEGLFALTGGSEAKNKYMDIYQEMLELQTLSDKGGMLYSTVQIKGHFTMGEELASLGWMGYLTAITEEDIDTNYGELVNWMPW